MLTSLGDIDRAVAARRRAPRELDALPERLRADMGLDRLGVASHVRSGRPFRPRARLRPSLRGCG